MYESIGLLVELLFFLLGLQVYRFASGKIVSKDEKARARAEQFRAENAKWMRPLALLLMAIMAVEIALHLSQLIDGSGS
jgi:hypothetical protein